MTKVKMMQMMMSLASLLSLSTWICSFYGNLALIPKPRRTDAFMDIIPYRMHASVRGCSTASV